MSIHATKAVEIGTGVANSAKPGSDVHDEIFYETDDSGGTLFGGNASVNERAQGGNASVNERANAGRFIRRTNRAGGLEGGITNGEEVRVCGYMKPISTLRKPLHSVDIDSKAEDLAAFERSDITAVPAAGVIGESMLAIVLANAMREKFGGDSMEEMVNNFRSYDRSIKEY
jgi:chorismate synthase